MEVKFIRVRRAKLPRFQFEKSDWQELGEIVAEGVVDNIKKSRQADGSKIQDNKPSTQLMKRNKGRGFQGTVRPLIDEEHRAIQSKGGSFETVAYKTNAKIRPATSWLKEHVPEWQQRGYVGWFGISKNTVTVMRDALERMIDRMFAKVR